MRADVPGRTGNQDHVTLLIKLCHIISSRRETLYRAKPSTLHFDECHSISIVLMPGRKPEGYDMYGTVSRLMEYENPRMSHFHLSQRLSRELNAHRDALIRLAFDGQAAAGDGQEGTVSEQATAGAGGGGAG